MRITGMASGFDTETMVQQLMNVERMKVNRYEQQKQVNLWRRDSYTKINKAMANFIVNTKKNFGLGGRNDNFNSINKLDYVKKAVSIDDKIASARVTGNAADGSFIVDVVEAGEDATFVSSELDKNAELTEDLVIEGVKVGKAGQKLEDVFKELSKNKELKEKGISAFYDESTKKMFVQGSGIEGKIKIKGLQAQKVDNYSIDLKDMKNDSILSNGIVIGGKLVGDTKGKTLEQALKELEKPENMNKLGIKNIDIEKDSTGKIKSLKFETELSDETLNIEGLGNNITHKIDSTSSFLEGTYVNGKKGKVTINGEEMEVKNNKVEFNGLSIDIKSKGKTTITVATDTDAIIEKVENFVKEYNDLLDLLNLSVNEKKYNSYHPLSKEEKEAMKDKDIELWEEKAKSGMLNRDETLNRILDGTRRNLYSSVNGLDEKFRISSLGITTGEYQKGSAGGKLEIDTEKLRKALEDNPEDAMRLLFENDGTSGKSRKPENQGVFTRIYDSMMDGMKEIVNKSGPGEDAALLQGIDRAITTDYNLKGKTSEIDKLVREMDQKIDDMNILLARKEDSYYAKFTAMEKYVYKMNSQSAWIGQQMM